MDKREERKSLEKTHMVCKGKSVGTDRRTMRIRCWKKKKRREERSTNGWASSAFAIVKILEMVFV